MALVHRAVAPILPPANAPVLQLSFVSACRLMGIPHIHQGFSGVDTLAV
jgi:hypothetical protein